MVNLALKSKKEDNVTVPQNVTGPVYDQKTKDLIITRLQPGDNFFIDEIIARGPAGDKRKLNPVAFVITK